ncbi:hypothetical protein [Rhizobium leguminosarum]|uniref:hypothetical protein n=1 Tax=Rhizobium leguminosarum TaxID=384 RepID=UPI001FE13A50|nr:hypothetical protein [Rhizobium leguminosarum]
MPLASWHASLPITGFAAPDAPFPHRYGISGSARMETRSIDPGSEQLAKQSTD